MIFAGTRGYLDALPVNAVGRFEEDFLRIMRDEHAGLLDRIRTEKALSSDMEQELTQILDRFAENFVA